MNIPVAHIQAGERSGTSTGSRATRSRGSRMSTSPRGRRRRNGSGVSGEEEFRIFTTGAPQLDELINGDGCCSRRDRAPLSP